MTHFLIGEITEQTTREVLAAMPQIDMLVLNTCGGDVHCAFALYDALRARPDIQVIGTGQVASSGILVLLGADRRSATPNTRFFVHPVSEHVENGKRIADRECEYLQTIIGEIVAERCGMALCKAKELFSQDRYFGVQYAGTLGIITSHEAA